MKMKEISKDAYNEKISKAKEACNKRMAAQVASLKEKAGNNLFKKFFYLGAYDFKNHKWEKEVFNWHTSMYDHFAYKKFLKYVRRIERKGINIKRWYMDETMNFRLYQSWENPYRKFCLSWWKWWLKCSIDHFTYDYKTCLFDYSDIFSDLIVKLTIKGLYIGLYGNSVTHKEQMHEIWVAREKLIKSYLHEDVADALAKRDVKSMYNVDWVRKSYDKDTYIESGDIVEPSDNKFHYAVDPKLVEATMMSPIGMSDKHTDTCSPQMKEKMKEYRERVCDKIDEIEKYYYDQREKHEDENAHDGFNYIGENIFDWWD